MYFFPIFNKTLLPWVWDMFPKYWKIIPVQLMREWGIKKKQYGRIVKLHLALGDSGKHPYHSLQSNETNSISNGESKKGLSASLFT